MNCPPIHPALFGRSRQYRKGVVGPIPLNDRAFLELLCDGRAGAIWQPLLLTGSYKGS